MLKKSLLVVLLSITATATFASGTDKAELQLKALDTAIQHEKLNENTEACHQYERAYLMGYLGSKGGETHPAQNKTIVHSGLKYASCVAYNDNFKISKIPAHAQIEILKDLKATYKSSEAIEELKNIQQDALSVAKSLSTMDHTRFLINTHESIQACTSAEIAHRIGFQGKESQKKNPKANEAFANSTILYATCLSMNPYFYVGKNKEHSNWVAKKMLSQLAKEYDSVLAKELLTPEYEPLKK